MVRTAKLLVSPYALLSALTSLLEAALTLPMPVTTLISFLLKISSENGFNTQVIYLQGSSCIEFLFTTLCAPKYFTLFRQVSN